MMDAYFSHQSICKTLLKNSKVPAKNQIVFVYTEVLNFVCDFKLMMILWNIHCKSSVMHIFLTDWALQKVLFQTF